LPEEILFIIASYLLGSIPFGFLIVRLTSGKDIRDLGSGNIGATNVLRSKGKMAALFTLLFDVAKAAIPIIYGRAHFDSPVLIMAGGAAAIIGHMFPLFLKFRGGKGVSTLAGVFLVMDLRVLGVFLAVFVTVIIASRFVSLGSISGAVAVFFAVLFTNLAEVAVLVLLVVILIILRHRSNIQRLIAGNENRLSLDRNG